VIPRRGIFDKPRKEKPGQELPAADTESHGPPGLAELNRAEAWKHISADLDFADRISVRVPWHHSLMSVETDDCLREMQHQNEMTYRFAVGLRECDDLDMGEYSSVAAVAPETFTVEWVVDNDLECMVNDTQKLFEEMKARLSRHGRTIPVLEPARVAVQRLRRVFEFHIAINTALPDKPSGLSSENSGSGESDRANGQPNEEGNGRQSTFFVPGQAAAGQTLDTDMADMPQQDEAQSKQSTIGVTGQASAGQSSGLHTTEPGNDSA